MTQQRIESCNYVRLWIVERLLKTGSALLSFFGNEQQLNAHFNASAKGITPYRIIHALIDLYSMSQIVLIRLDNITRQSSGVSEKIVELGEYEAMELLRSIIPLVSKQQFVNIPRTVAVQLTQKGMNWWCRYTSFDLDLFIDKQGSLRNSPEFGKDTPVIHISATSLDAVVSEMLRLPVSDGSICVSESIVIESLMPFEVFPYLKSPNGWRLTSEVRSLSQLTDAEVVLLESQLDGLVAWLSEIKWRIGTKYDNEKTQYILDCDAYFARMRRE